jgi:tRNA pseudouridine55 synthase
MAGRGRRQGRPVDGILLLDKPTGISSNQALQRAKRLFEARKAGHTGNLDVMASGLLPVCFGEATKFSGFLLNADKHYRSTFKLGQTTDTGDAEGLVITESEVGKISEAELGAVLERFRGAIEQVPPMHSAIKRAGQPLYKLARQGIEVKREPRPVQIYSLEVLRLQGNEVDLDVRCSKGTYVRTLAEEVGRELGCGAHVCALRRLGVAPYDAESMVDFATLQAAKEQGWAVLDGYLLPMDSALQQYPAVELTEDSSFYLRRGQPILVPRAPTDGLVRLYDPARVFLGLGEVADDGRIAPRRLVQ